MRPRSAFDAVLFDYSGVMTTPFGAPETTDLEVDRGALESHMAAALMGLDPAHPWLALERGEIELSVFLDYVEENAPGATPLFDPNSAYCVMANLDVLEERVELVRRTAAAGYQVGLVTNNVAEWAPLWRTPTLEELFEIVIDSAEVGCRKPEPTIYELAMDRLGLSDPSRVVFIDDFPWNVEGAEAVGMVGLNCGADTDLDTELAQLLLG